MRQSLIERWKSFTKEQKLSVVVLVVCGFLAIGVSVYQMRENVRGPFLTDKAKALAFKQSLTPTDEALEAKQKRTDTDGDGISDWDEVNVYHTNPNLKDTCGDGVPDNVRLATGKNVACTDAKNIEANLDVSAIDASSSSIYSGEAAVPNPNAIITDAMNAAARTGGGATAPSDAGSATVGSSIPRDPAAIRAALQGKVDQAKLDAVTDQQLLQYYDTALAEQQAAAASGAAPAAQ